MAQAPFYLLISRNILRARAANSTALDYMPQLAVSPTLHLANLQSAWPRDLFDAHPMRHAVRSARQCSTSRYHGGLFLP
jgi:hypothetical protein